MNEIGSLKQQGAIFNACNCVGKAIAKIQLGWMPPPFAEFVERGTGLLKMRARKRDNGYIRHGCQLFGVFERFGESFTAKHRMNFKKCRNTYDTIVPGQRIEIFLVA